MLTAEEKEKRKQVLKEVNVEAVQSQLQKLFSIGAMVSEDGTIKIPNEETLEALKESEEILKSPPRYSSVEDFFKDLES